METATPSCEKSPGVVKRLETSTGLRERPKTMLTPETKRSKTTLNLPSGVVLTPEGKMAVAVPAPSGPKVIYPTTIPVPSRRVIESLYNAALVEEEDEPDDQAVENKSHDDYQYNNQKYLKPAGILSFEEILLPAVALEEEKALKQVQAKVQRDAPEYKFVVENCRRMVRKSVRDAIVEVQTARVARTQRQRERRLEQALETKRLRENRRRVRLEEKERWEREQALKLENERAEKKRQLAREYPRNQELWKEIVFLTSSLAQLEREQRIWVQIEKDILRAKKNDAKKDRESIEDGSSSSSSSSSSDAVVVKAQKNPIQVETEEKVKDIVLASSRIQKGLEMVLELLDESETVRKNLYDKYRKNHAFHGYEGMDDPKGIVRFLSQQSQDDDVPDNPKDVFRFLSQSQDDFP
mmetsp:Transcript_16114/g.44599  ORF Transcript_16114/g.44599 Transcript_16114/m.44599 type:complete len:410 (-) Transcript_16114:99-1328(-)|eukprot:CAMPEP_0172370852 /NCGR_PEP_ID=MMETSP1060-20121228/40024_1 /TAXON_ID=37318 /ORGANISM="Pseudo-nitzschia pungens, Strain cf. cingulata" /LENGTH=409 /DNA_ID=CAMNT_0013096287 /DNA_START=70 /DNA_END=1299 /DNA_ORIENTATION=+